MDCLTSIDLRDNTLGLFDWDESRNDTPTLLILDTSDIAGNTGNKAGILADGSSPTVYMSQEFSQPQTNSTFNLSLDITIDTISNYSNYDRTAFIFVGDDSGGTNGPSSTGSERFVMLAFYDPTPESNGSDLILKARETIAQAWATTSTWKTLATNLSYDTLNTIKLNIDVQNRIYDVYLNDILVGDNVLAYEEFPLTTHTVTHVTFSGGGTARGNFYIDNVYSPAGT